MQVTANISAPIDIIMSASPAGAFALLTADFSFQPLNGSEPPPTAFIIEAQVLCVFVYIFL
jgi:hypothetical protein